MEMEHKSRSGRTKNREIVVSGEDSNMYPMYMGALMVGLSLGGGYFLYREINKMKEQIGKTENMFNEIDVNSPELSFLTEQVDTNSKSVETIGYKLDQLLLLLNRDMEQQVQQQQVQQQHQQQHQQQRQQQQIYQEPVDVIPLVRQVAEQEYEQGPVDVIQSSIPLIRQVTEEPKEQYHQQQQQQQSSSPLKKRESVEYQIKEEEDCEDGICIVPESKKQFKQSRIHIN